MHFSRFKSRVQNFHKLFILPHKIWRLPKKSDVVIYDATGSEVFLPYLASYSVEILELRGESVNLPCLLLSIFKLKFWAARPVQAYAEVYIALASPKIVLTFMDNNINFYSISNIFPKIKTIFVQNGMRGGRRDIFAHLTFSGSYRVDYMLVFNKTFGETYKKYIAGEFVAIGSVRNNISNESVELVNDTVLFISQFRLKPTHTEMFTEDANGNSVSWEKFYESEALILPFLDRWCAENNKQLRVVGCMLDHQHIEHRFFADYLRGCEWEFVPKTDSYSTYKLLDTAEIVVFIDSALGYESIGRRKKTAGFSIRGSIINDPTINFGWPVVLPNNGPFWTNDINRTRFVAIMDHLNVIASEEWQDYMQLYASKLMVFDSGNQQLIALLEQTLSSPDGIL